MKQTTSTQAACCVPRSIRLGALVGATLLAGAGLSAQPADDDMFAFELSPFEVSATDNIGYRATDTLAGIRVRTDLREVGSAISVVTAQQLQDTGATSSQSLLQYTVGTEVGGLDGNFGGVVTGGGELNDQGQRQTPQSNTRVRGLVSADNTRDFFLTDIPWDSYNTSRVDIQRGPNSILFGQGSGGGIVNQDVQGATLGSNSGRIEFRISKFGGRRGSLNLTRDIIDNELAMRVALLDDETKYRQDPTYNRDRRIYGALRWEPDFLRIGESRTRFNANFEKGQIRANRPRTATMIDHVSPYFRTSPEQMVAPDGTVLGTLEPMRTRTGYDPYVITVDSGLLAEEYPNRLDLGAANINMDNAEPWLRPSANDDFGGLISTGFWAIFPDENDADMAYFRANNFLVSNGNKLSNTGANVPGQPQGIRAPAFRSINALTGYATERNFLYQRQGLYRDVMISDPGIFNFYEHLLDGPNKREWADFKAYNLNVVQSFFSEKVSMQFSYDRQQYSDGREEYIGGIPRLMIDLMSHLPMAVPDGQGNLVAMENPNFGRPFVLANAGGTNERFVTRTTYRFTPYAELDFGTLLDRENILVKFLGRHQFTGLLERNEIHNENRSWQRYALTTDTTAAIGGNPNLGIARGERNMRTMNYLGGSVINASSISELNIPAITAQRNIGTAPAWYFDSNYLPNAPAPNTAWEGPELGLLPSNRTGATFSPLNRFQSENPLNYRGWGQHGEITVWNGDNAEDRPNLYRNWSEGRDVVESWALVDQWRLLDDHIILLGGIRKDKVVEHRGWDGSGDPAEASGNRPRIGGNDGHVDLNSPWELVKTSEFKSDTLVTWSAVVKSPDFINRHLPWEMNATVFYSESENFQPVTRVGLFGDPLAPPQADTKEYGFTLEAFNGRVMLKVNRFETNVTGATLNDNIDFNFPARTADEVARSAEMALRVLTLDRSDNPSVTGTSGYRFQNPNDETDLNFYAYQPATGTQDDWTSADFAAANALARQQAEAALASLDNDRARTYMNAWGISDPNVYYQQWLADPDNTPRYDNGWQGLNGFAMTGDTVSKGTEVELFVRPTDNWDIAFNFAKVSAKRLNLTGEIAEWVEDRWALYQPNPDGSNPGPGGLRWFGGSQGAATADTGLARMGRNAYWRYSLFRAQEGNNTPELRPYRFNIITTYRFTEGPLDGFFVGGGYRWQDSNVIGYAPIVVGEEILGDGTVQPVAAFDVDSPFKGSSEDAIDLWGGYTRTIMNGRVDWRIQLNLRNVGDNKRLIPATTNPDGSIAGYRIAEGMTWQLSTSFDF